MEGARQIPQQLQQQSKLVIEDFRKELATLRTGRANPAMLDRVVVDYYGSQTPLPQLATISVPEPRTLLIQAWDKNAVKEIERALLKSDLGLTPAVDGNLIRLTIPPLTEERRKELVKVARKMAEEHRVAVRNLRRDANERIKKAEKAEGLSENDVHKLQEEVQKGTDRSIEQIDHLLTEKEKEILEV